MDSGTLSTVSSPKAMDSTEVLSQRVLGQGEPQEAVKTSPKGKTLVAGHLGEQTAMDTDGGGHIKFDPQPNTIPETHTTPKSGKQPLSR